MSVDMFERRFRSELRKLPKFEPNDERDMRVWKADFPAWRALFSSLCLFGHSTGYRLPSFEDFFRYCENAYSRRHPDSTRFSPYFAEELRNGMRQRVAAWYESGMAETYLYACLVEAIEDKAKLGIVLYDPRADWKLKADIIAIAKDRPIRVSAYAGSRNDRPDIEEKRDLIERIRKKNTMESAHWKNAELEKMPALAISLKDGNMQVVNGVRLFSLRSVNALLSSMYETWALEGWYFPLSQEP